MPIPPADLTNLLSLQKPAVCGYWFVEWDPDDPAEDRYYSDSIYSQLPPFTGVGVDIEARILNSVVKDTAYEINPDLRTETISLTFDDIDREISGRFQTFRSGVRCELFFYYPNPGADPITHSAWFGQLQAPKVYGHKTVQTTATNGFRSREQLVGKRTRPRECTANWGGWMPSTFASETNLCPAGPFGTIPSNDLDCPRDSEATCNSKLGTTDARYYGGFNTDASATVTQTNNGGYIAVSKGNQSALKEPIRVIFGTKYIRALQLLLWRREHNSSTPAHGFVAGVWEIGEGPVSLMFQIRVRDKVLEVNHHADRMGERGQPRSGYASQMSNFSNTAHFYGRYGWVDPSTITAEDLTAECYCQGFADVAVWSDSSTYIREWTDNRIWCLMEIYTNQRFGMAYPASRFTPHMSTWIDRATWADNLVRFTALFLDGEEKLYTGRRTTFDCALEGRPVAEQIEDICRSGAICVPFQDEGAFTIRSFDAATDDQIDDARVFYDDGQHRNILWGGEQPDITLSQIPDDKVVNEVLVTFEENTNFDVERPITVDDPNQKLKAGRVLGDNNLQSVPKRFAGFGIRKEQEAARLAYRILRFGEFDEGGTQNNLRVTFKTPFEQVLGIKRYDIIKIVSSLLNGFEIGTGEWIINPDYFRVLKMKKVANGLVEVTAQAYNDAAYLDFDVAGTVPEPPVTSFCTIDNDCDPGYICVNGRCIEDPGGHGCRLTIDTVTYDETAGAFVIAVPPC